MKGKWERLRNIKCLKMRSQGCGGMKEVIVIEVVVGALGAILSGFEKYIAAIKIEMGIEHAEKTALLGTSKILRLGLGC